MDDDGPVLLEMTLIVGEGFEGEEVDRNGVAAKSVEDDDIILLVGLSFHRESGVAHNEFRLRLRILQVGEGVRREASDVIINFVEAERIAWAAPGGEGAGA